MEKKRSRYGVIYMVIVCVVLAGFGLASLFRAPKSYSENENRYLAQYPAFSLSDFLSGDLQDSFTEALSDQFVGRDAFMKCATAVKQILGQREVSDVYLGSDNYYLPKVTTEEIDQKQYLQNLRYVEYLGETCEGTVRTLLVPSAGTILKEELPDNAPYYKAGAMYKAANTILKKAKNIDVRSELKEYAKQNQVYYRTDHHWTLLGAYAAYSVYCVETGLDKHAYTYFAPKKVSQDFLGTLYSKVMPLFYVKDTVYAVTNLPKVSVYYEGVEKSTIYDVEQLTKKDKYAYFFGGNYSEVVITGNEEPETELLVIKDSYANSFVPFLMDSFDRITMIDLRYYKESVQELLQENSYDNVLVLYEISNFAEDTNLYKLVQ